jgi:hypothetical protein
MLYPQSISHVRSVRYGSQQAVAIFIAICVLLIGSLRLPRIISESPMPAATARDGAVFVPIVENGALVAPPAGSIVFVSRQLNTGGSIYWDAPQVKDMPGVGPHSRVRPAAPGRLIVREPNGAMHVLVDGSRPTSATLDLIDVNAPDVSYDGTTIVFAGLPKGNYNTAPARSIDGWRIFSIRCDGTQLRQITFDDQDIDVEAFGLPEGLLGYDDFDPVWLPDGRIAFSSTRYPAYAHYSGVRTSNIHVVHSDGAALHRITTERNGADRPTVDPLTGRIIYSRWWRNHRFGLDDMTTVGNEADGYLQKDGLSSDRGMELDGTSRFSDYLWRNAWHLATINPDGTNLKKFATAIFEEQNHAYGGTFLADGSFLANYFPMYNMTEAGGFGGLRIFKREGSSYKPFLGVTTLSSRYVNTDPTPSYGIYPGEYATEPAALASGELLISIAPDVGQDYGIYRFSADGARRTLVYDAKGTAELRAKPIAARARPPILTDTVTAVASLMPPPAAGPYAQDGVFVFDVFNVYANGPIDSDIIDAVPVGSAAKLRFFTDFQRKSYGSYPMLDWPILLAETTVSPSGAAIMPHAPANLPLFEQMRDKNDRIPLSRDIYGFNGAGHVAGLNFGRPGEVMQCVGCHTGHSMIPVPTSRTEAQFTNLAPGAEVTVSTARDPNFKRAVVDRRVNRSEIWRSWTSTPGSATGQWVKLTFPVPVTVRTVRLYNPRQGDEAASTLQVNAARVTLYSDAAGLNAVASQTSGALATSGTDVQFAEVRARVVRIDLLSVSGTFYGAAAAGLAEVEVFARGEADLNHAER